MNNLTSKIPLHRFFKLPFKHGTRILERKTLDSLSEFRPPKRGYLTVSVKLMSFINEIVSASIRFENEDLEMVYMKVTQDHLLISCSMDTDESHLSINSYFFLNKYFWFYPEISFEEYYYPDFFDQEKGTSKYLKIVRTKGGLSIKLKESFWNLFKPGVSLPNIPLINKERKNIIIENQPSTWALKNKTVLAYCLLDPLNLHKKPDDEKELTLLIPFAATLNNDKRNFKSLLTYLNNETVADDLEFHPDQIALNEICEEMWENSLYSKIRNFKDEDSRRTFSDRKKLQFDLWQNALPLLVNERFTCYQWSYGLRYIKGKPTKKDIRFCQIASEIPKLKFFLIDKGDYYFLDLKFMVNGIILKFAFPYMPLYFAAAASEPMKFYLLASPADSELVNYFLRLRFRLIILKKHYDSYIMPLVQQIEQIYGITKR